MILGKQTEKLDAVIFFGIIFRDFNDGEIPSLFWGLVSLIMEPVEPRRGGGDLGFFLPTKPTRVFPKIVVYTPKWMVYNGKPY